MSLQNLLSIKANEYDAQSSPRSFFHDITILKFVRKAHTIDEKVLGKDEGSYLQQFKFKMTPDHEPSNIGLKKVIHLNSTQYDKPKKIFTTVGNSWCWPSNRYIIGL